MGKKYILLVTCLYISITLACASSDGLEPAITVAPTLALQAPPSTAYIPPESAAPPAIAEPASLQSTDAAAPTPTARPPATKRPTTASIPPDTPDPPTDTPVPTAATSTYTPLPPTPPPTETPLPPAPQPPSDTPIPSPTLPEAGGQIVIVGVDKAAEFVDLQNIGGQAQDIGSWILVSEKGDQRCTLAGVVEAGAVLRVWALASDIGQGGYNCGFNSNIWNNSEPDPAALYDNAGNLLDRYP